MKMMPLFNDFSKQSDQILEWNGIPLTGKTYEEVQAIINESYGEIEIIINSDANLQRNQSTSNPAVIPTADSGYANRAEQFHGSGYVSTGLLDGKASPCFSSTPPQQVGLQSLLLKQQQQQQRLQSQLLKEDYHFVSFPLVVEELLFMGYNNN
uniref:PDZ domain-containing protein n=1 Tax=Romanomermis culicivorax TaxID=13658 RepID=A0A915JC31_ROMCU